ncbi:DNA mismatch repair protein MutL [Trichinella pseudospiralis]
MHHYLIYGGLWLKVANSTNLVQEQILLLDEIGWLSVSFRWYWARLRLESITVLRLVSSGAKDGLALTLAPFLIEQSLEGLPDRTVGKGKPRVRDMVLVGDSGKPRGPWAVSVKFSLELMDSHRQLV